MYYVYEKIYDDGRRVAIISNNPLEDNLTNEIKFEGFCGFDEDLAETYAHGVYETIEQAAEAVGMIFEKTKFHLRMPKKFHEQGIVSAYEVIQ